MRVISREQCVPTHLNQILALWLGDERLELRSGEGVDEARLRHDKKQDLGAGEDGELIGLRVRR